jgi:hypothetical protein
MKSSCHLAVAAIGIAVGLLSAPLVLASSSLVGFLTIFISAIALVCGLQLLVRARGCPLSTECPLAD